MNYRKILILIVTGILLVGCTDDESGHDELRISELENELSEVKLTLETTIKLYDDMKLQKDLRISELESELNEVKLALEKKTELNDEMKLQNEIMNEKLSQEISDLSNDIIKLEEEVSEYRTQLEITKKENRSKSIDAILIKHSNKRIQLSDEDMYASPINIIGYNRDDSLFEQVNFELIDMSVENSARVHIRVTGSLYEFKLIELGWDSATQDTYEKEIIYSSDEVRNTDILFSSPLYEGMHSNIVKWKDSNNNEDFIYISFDGSGLIIHKIIIAD